RHPLRVVTAGLRVAVEANRSGPGGAVVVRAGVEDVAHIARVGTARGIVVVNHAPRTDSRLTPAHVPPDWTWTAGNGSKAAAEGLAGRSKRRPHLNRCPGLAAVQRAVSPIDSIADAAATLIHPEDEHGSAVIGATGQLDVPDESACSHLDGSGPGRPVVGVRH